jgi:molybdenum cofactor cytidylyltransferase
MRSLGAIVLAAGASERFGVENKLLADIRGQPLIRQVVREVLGSNISDLVVVTGWDEARIGSSLKGLPARHAFNAKWQLGLGTSIAAGVAALSPNVDGAFVVPGDMPRLSSFLLVRLAQAFEQEGRRVVVFPVTANGDQRNPVLWPRRYFGKLTKLSGPRGAKGLLQSRGVECLAVPVDDEAILEDIDTIGDLKRLQRSATPR